MSGSAETRKQALKIIFSIIKNLLQPSQEIAY